MTQLSLKEKFERLGPIRDIDRVISGSAEIVSLELRDGLRPVKSISAVVALRRRHAPALKAKRAIEAAMAGETAVLEVPMVEDLRQLATELAENGFTLRVATPRAVDVKSLRERLGMTQEQFALSYGLDVDAIRNWEYGRREPDTAAKSYLTVIDREPQRTRDALVVPVT